MAGTNKPTIEDYFNDLFDRFNESKYSIVKDKDGKETRIQIGHLIGTESLKRPID